MSWQRRQFSCLSVVFYYTSILFVLHECRNLFSVAHFRAGIVVFSARFGAASFFLKFAFCSTTYVRPLSHLSLLGFVAFVVFTLRCVLFFILRFQVFSSKTHALSHTIFRFCYLMKRLGETLSILLRVVLLTVCCCLIYVDTFRSTWRPEIILCCALRCSQSRLLCALQCCLLLLQLCLLFNHLRSSAFSLSSSVFCRFRIFHTLLSSIFHTSLSAFFLHKLTRFLILSLISVSLWSVWAKRCQFYCVSFYWLSVVL